MSQRKADSGKTPGRWTWPWIRKEARGYAEALAIAYIVVTFLFTTVGVVGASMLPSLDGGPGSQALLQSLLTGDRVFIPKYDTWLRRAGILGEYQRGEVVVLRPPPNAPTAQITGERDFFIKRIAAVPGDSLRIDAGQVIVNGHPIDQAFIGENGIVEIAPVDFPVISQSGGELTGVHIPFVSAGSVPVPRHTPAGDHPPAVSPEDEWVQLYFGSSLAALAPIPDDAPEGTPFVHEIVIPAGHYFVVGDNRGAGGSEDSRLFGPVPALSIAGRASAVIWPPARDGEWNWRFLGIPAAFESVPPS